MHISERLAWPCCDGTAKLQNRWQLRQPQLQQSAEWATFEVAVAVAAGVVVPAFAAQEAAAVVAQ